MQAHFNRSRAGLRPAALALSALSIVSAASAYGQVAPALQHSAISLGQQRPSAPITGTVWLQLHNKAALDAAVQAMYTPGSPTYQKFQGPEALKQFAPTSAEIESVKKELSAHKLTVLRVDPNNFSIKIQGQTSDFEAAFHTTVNQYRMKSGAVVSALATAPTLGNGAAGMVQAVTGIAGPGMQPFIQHPVDPATGKQIGIVPATGSENPEGVIFSSNCFYAPQNVTLGTPPGAALPIAVYGGLTYGAPVTNTVRGTISPCAYSPADMYKLTGIDKAQARGYTGKGQTIAIVDAYGSPTIQSDFAAFNATYKLTPATSSNFQVIQTMPFTATDAGWAGETTLDVEWSHAIAPDANIALVTVPSNSDDDLQSGVLYVIVHHLANVISNSYGQGELGADTQTVTSWDEICELGAFEGISVNFATGDSGDYQAVEKVTDVSLPADSPYATAVGGTSLAYSPVDGSPIQTGWGTNLTQLSSPKGVTDPPAGGFYGGAGGGVSQLFKLPGYQASLHGSGRQIPDVSADADPFTGVEILFTIKGVRYFEVTGGTSLATPIFSAEWALLDQRFGFPLGQAAPYIAQAANTPLIQDVDVPSGQLSVQGAILDAKGLTNYSAEALGMPQTGTPFLGALYNDGAGDEYDVTFGTDTSLAVGQGWDPVTGWGTLNMGAIFTTFAGVK